MSEKLQDITIKKLNEEKKYSINDAGKEYPRIEDYRVGKTGVRFTAYYYILKHNAKSDIDDFRLECQIEIKNNGEILNKFDIATYEGVSMEDISNPDKFVDKAIKKAVKDGYIEQKDGIYVDKKEAEKTKAKSEFLNMINLSDEEIKSKLPGKKVAGLSSDANWEVYGIFTAYNGKDYVAMKKTGMFADPNIVELSRFKKSYKLID